MITKTIYLYVRAKSVEADARQDVKHARRRLAKGLCSPAEYERVKSERWDLYNDLIGLRQAVCNEALGSLPDSLSECRPLVDSHGYF